MSSIDIWSPQPSREGQTVHWQLGPLDIWVTQTAGEWHVAARRCDDRNVASIDCDPPSTEVEWRRWAASVEQPSLKLTPMLPNRPVIVRPADPIQILPGQEARFFVGIPMWTQLTIKGADGKELEICQEHTVQLSNSWFGTPQDGELCYALRTRARRALAEISSAPHRVVCPLVLRNGSDNALDFQRLCLRTAHLAIFRGKSRLWANQGRVTFKGEEAMSHIDYSAGPPPFDEADTMLGAAREAPVKGIVAKTFGNLRAISPF